MDRLNAEVMDEMEMSETERRDVFARVTLVA